MEWPSLCRDTNMAGKTLKFNYTINLTTKDWRTLKVPLNQLISISNNKKKPFNWFSFVYFHGFSEIA